MVIEAFSTLLAPATFVHGQKRNWSVKVNDDQKKTKNIFPKVNNHFFSPFSIKSFGLLAK